MYNNVQICTYNIICVCHYLLLKICFLYSYRPDLIDYDLLSPNDHIDNLNNAFVVAEQHLGLPQLLDAEGVYCVCTCV